MEIWAPKQEHRRYLSLSRWKMGDWEAETERRISVEVRCCKNTSISKRKGGLIIDRKDVRLASGPGRITWLFRRGE